MRTGLSNPRLDNSNGSLMPGAQNQEKDRLGLNFRMNNNPYQAPRADVADEAGNSAHSVTASPKCPICDRVMEAGFIASSSSLYWRQWTNQKWLLRGNESLSKTSSVFGINKLSGYRCVDCEIVLFAYGKSRKRFSPDAKSD